MSTNVLLSKTYISEILNDYQEIVLKIDEIIAQTGYQGKFIAQKLGLPESTFYQKKRRKSFTLDEMKQLVELMDEEEDDDDIEDEYFMKIYKEREHEEVIHDIFNDLKK
jgi:predicted transcriptional regulator